MGRVYSGVHPMQVWSTDKCLPLQLGVMVHAVCSQSELQVWVLQRAFCWCRCCAWWGVESACWSPLSFLMPRPAWGKVLSIEKQCASLQFVRNILNQFPPPPKRESCLEKCKSLNCGRACMCGLLDELSIISSSIHNSRGH